MPYDLELRFCRCQCGKSWRALPSSKNEYALKSHEPRNNLPGESFWHSERSRFRAVSRWLNDTCPPESYIEPEPYDAVLEEIRD